MPNLTPIYSLPSPLLTEQADAAAAFTALNTRIEREMPTLRALNSYSNVTTRGLVLGTDVAVHAVSTSMVVIGWAEVEFRIFMTAIGTDPAPLWAGFVNLVLNGTQLRHMHFHNQGRAISLNITGSAAIAIPSGVTSLSSTLNVNADPASNGYTVYDTDLSVRQFGAPNSG